MWHIARGHAAKSHMVLGDSYGKYVPVVAGLSFGSLKTTVEPRFCLRPAFYWLG